MSSFLYTNLPKLEVVFHFKHPASGRLFSSSLDSFIREGCAGQKDKAWCEMGSDRTTSKAQRCEWARRLWSNHPKGILESREQAGIPAIPHPPSWEAPGCEAGISLPSSESGAKVPRMQLLGQPDLFSAGIVGQHHRNPPVQSTVSATVTVPQHAWLHATDSAGISACGLDKPAVWSHSMVGSRMSWGQHGPPIQPCGKEGHQPAGLLQEGHCHQGWGDESSLLSAGEATAGVQGPALGSPVQERHYILDSPVSPADMVRELEHLQYEETRRGGIVQPRGGFMKILRMCTYPWSEKV